MKNKKIILESLVYVVGVLVYVFLVSQIFIYGDRWFGKQNLSIFGPFAFLLLFTLSAAVVGGLILGKPVYLFFSNKKKESIRIVLYNIGWLFIFTVFVLLLLAIT